MLHPEMTAHRDTLEITETKMVEVNSVLPRREGDETVCVNVCICMYVVCMLM